MHKARLRRYSDAQVLELAALIHKRKAEGLGPTLIAQRLGVGYFVVRDILDRQEAIMAKTSSKALPMLLARMRDTTSKIKAGMQTHTTQDLQAELILTLDAIESDLKAMGIETKVEPKPPAEGE